MLKITARFILTSFYKYKALKTYKGKLVMEIGERKKMLWFGVS